jgi:CheY-like chemotaxis protein
MKEICTVLLAEDNDDQALLMERFWKKLDNGVRFLRVPDGEQAIQYLDGYGPYQDRIHYPFPSVLLLDHHMPHYSGLSVLKWIKEKNLEKQLYIALLTLNNDPNLWREAYELGVRLCLSKSDSLRTIVEIVASLNPGLSKEDINHIDEPAMKYFPRIVVENAGQNFYLKDIDLWTADLSEARTFRSSVEALSFARKSEKCFQPQVFISYPSGRTKRIKMKRR